jgi:hypothetical protein
MQFLGSRVSYDNGGENIIIETRLLVPPGLKKFKSEFSVEILKLNEHFGPTFLDCQHELFDELLGFGVWNALLSQPEIVVVFKELVIVSSVIQSNLLVSVEMIVERAQAKFGLDEFLHRQHIMIIFRLESPYLR